MGRLIDESKAYDVLTDYYHHSTDIQHAALREALARVESVDAVPVVHGHWKEDPSGYGFWICSACGFVSEASATDMLYKFCPVCGALLELDGAVKHDCPTCKHRDRMPGMYPCDGCSGDHDKWEGR